MYGNYPDGVREGDPMAPWNYAEPERTCGNCLFCKDVGRGLACVEEVYNSKDEDALYRAELYEVTVDQEPCDKWKDGE